MKKETGRWKDRWKIRGLLADGRCSQAVLDLLSSTAVGRRVPAEEEDAVSAVSELEVREWLEEQGAGAEEPGGEKMYLCGDERRKFPLSLMKGAVRRCWISLLLRRWVK